MMIQIYYVAKLYRILEKIEDEPKMRFFSDKKIIDYLEELPEDVVKKKSSNYIWEFVSIIENTEIS